MKAFTIHAALAAALILPATAAMAGAPLYEEELARQEERNIIAAPIAGIRNARWYDYRTNIGEAQKELATDLRKASDTEDRRDAWEEYRTELSAERGHYVKEMRERGYRFGIVTVGG